MVLKLPETSDLLGVAETKTAGKPKRILFNAFHRNDVGRN